MNTSKTPQTREVTKSFFGGKLLVSQRVTEWDDESCHELSIRSSRSSCASPEFPDFPKFPEFSKISESQSGFSLVTRNNEIHATTFGEFLRKLFRAFVSRS